MNLYFILQQLKEMFLNCFLATKAKLKKELIPSSHPLALSKVEANVIHTALHFT